MAKTNKVLRWMGVVKDKILPGLTPDEMQIELRDLYDIELTDLVAMNKELAAFKTMSNVEKWHGPQKIRRRFWKDRIRKAINFIQQSYYNHRRYEQSWERKRQLYKIELDPKVAALQNPHLPLYERKKIQEEIKEVISRDEKNVSQEEKLNREAAQVIGYYRQGGMYEKTQNQIFFISHRRAALVTLLKIEKIRSVRSLHDKPLTDEERAKYEESIVIIDQKIKELAVGIDLKSIE